MAGAWVSGSGTGFCWDSGSSRADERRMFYEARLRTGCLFGLGRYDVNAGMCMFIWGG